MNPSSSLRPDLLPATITPSTPLQDQVRRHLEPLFTASQSSSSLIASQTPLRLQGESFEIPKFLLLGERGGGRPIRLGIFAGFDAAKIAPVGILAELLGDLRQSRETTRDYALFAYPVVNVRGFAEPALPLFKFEERFARNSADADVQYFVGELERWAFNGLLFIRHDRSQRGFHAAVRSGLIASEVVTPALAEAGAELTVGSPGVIVRPGDRYARAADYASGKLSAPPAQRPYPFEIELFVPERLTAGASAAVVAVIGAILRRYRALLSHAQDL